MVNRIAISGKANTGKTTIAKHAKSYLESKDSQKYNTKLASFADPMKHIAKLMFPDILLETLWGPSENRERMVVGAMNMEKGCPLAARQLLLDLGKFGREKSMDVWVNATLKPLEGAISKDKTIVALIDDLRFRNEFDKCRTMGYTLIRIHRPNNQKIIDDISETDLDNVPNSAFDHIIYNDEDLDALTLKIEGILDSIL